jgi:hypothetical protein
MPEKISPEKVLDTIATRKPSVWADAILLSQPTKVQMDYFRGLPLFYAQSEYSPLDELAPLDDNGKKYKMPKRFLMALSDDSLIYVNTEGYSYCRYAIRLDIHAVFPDSIPRRTTPVIPCPVRDEPSNEPEAPVEDSITETRKPCRIEPEEPLHPDNKQLLLAAKALTCYLEYKGYPAGSKLLVKMLNEAIVEHDNNE